MEMCASVSGIDNEKLADMAEEVRQLKSNGSVTLRTVHIKCVRVYGKNEAVAALTRTQSGMTALTNSVFGPIVFSCRQALRVFKNDCAAIPPRLVVWTFGLRKIDRRRGI